MNDPIDLTPHGEARRDDILASALAAARAKRRRRAIGRGTAVAAVILVGVIAGNALLNRPARLSTEVATTHPASPATAATPIATNNVVPNFPSVVMVQSADPRYAKIVNTDVDTMLRKYVAAPHETMIVKTIDDAQLLASLSKAGRPASLAYVGEKVILVQQ